MDLDQGGRRLAAHVLDAAGRGDHDLVAELVAPLNAPQLRSLVTVLAAQVDQTLPAADATGPAAVCGLAITAAAHLFDTTPDAILSAERTRTVSDARAAAMTAARSAGLTLPAIAEHFDKDYGSVAHAIRRTASRPRLDDAAATIGEHINRRYAERLPRTGREAEPVDKPGPGQVSTFETTNLIEHAVVAAAAAFNTTPERIVGPDRSRMACDARAVAMAAARLHGQSLPRIAAHFDRDHTAVLHATRRIDKTPPLKALAVSIADQLPKVPGAGGQDQVPADGEQALRPVPGASPRHHSPTQPDRHLSVAR